MHSLYVTVAYVVWADAQTTEPNYMSSYGDVSRWPGFSRSYPESTTRMFS